MNTESNKNRTRQRLKETRSVKLNVRSRAGAFSNCAGERVRKLPIALRGRRKRSPHHVRTLNEQVAPVSWRLATRWENSMNFARETAYWFSHQTFNVNCNTNLSSNFYHLSLNFKLNCRIRFHNVIIVCRCVSNFIITKYGNKSFLARK